MALNLGNLISQKMHKISYKSFIIAFLATMLRYYDYGLFGLSAAVISKTFMPHADEESQLFSFFAIFMMVVIMRPVGSLIFGKVGDSMGRIVSVKIATIIASISTMAIGFIPSYEQIGIWAAIFLVISRLIFMMSLAGEIDAIKIYIAEMVDKKRRNFASSLVTLSAQFGVLIAASSYHLAMSVPEMPNLWRLSFIVGGLLGLVLFTLRGFLEESRLFLEAKKNPDIFDDMHLYQIVFHHKLKFTLAMVINGTLGGMYNFLIIFLATFVSKVMHLISATEAAAINIKLVAIYGFAGIAAGVMADRMNYFVQAITALIVTLLLAIVWQVFASNNIYPLQLHKAIVCAVPFFMLPSYAKVQTLFANNIRMRMCSLSHSIGSLIFSSTIPIICMFIWRHTGSYIAVMGCFVLQITIVLLAVWVIYKQNYRNELDAHLQP